MIIRRRASDRNACPRSDRESPESGEGLPRSYTLGELKARGGTVTVQPRAGPSVH